MSAYAFIIYGRIDRQVSTVKSWEEKWWQQMRLKFRMAFSDFTPLCTDEIFNHCYLFVKLKIVL